VSRRTCSRFEHAFSGQEVAETLVMLFGQDGGRSHDGNLCPMPGNHHRAQGGHDGLAGANVALDEAVHRVAGQQVGADVGHSAGLRPGEGEGQGGDTRLQPVIRRLEDAGADGFKILLLAQDAHLQVEDFVKSQTLRADLRVS
jgi:hypothetical protein